jgi:hypothetical protein
MQRLEELTLQNIFTRIHTLTEQEIIFFFEQQLLEVRAPPALSVTPLFAEAEVIVDFLSTAARAKLAKILP